MKFMQVCRLQQGWSRQRLVIGHWQPPFTCCSYELLYFTCSSSRWTACKRSDRTAYQKRYFRPFSVGPIIGNLTGSQTRDSLTELLQI